MRQAVLVFLFACTAASLAAQDKVNDPTNEKAQKTYKEALEDVHQRMYAAALEAFKKADKQDGSHCGACQQKIIKYGVELHEWKSVEAAAQEAVADAQDKRSTALAHYQLGLVWIQEGLEKHKDELFARAHDEMTQALTVYPAFPDAIFVDGQTLARLKQDDAAKAQFERFVKMAPPDDPNRQRAMRFITEPDMARARMAPAFGITTMDGQNISIDDMKGKVILIDFWATWCGPCREALPHMKEIAKKFQGQPLVVISVSLDSDEQKWKDFVAKNEMTWLQCRDGGFTGPVSRLFGVQAIPQTFTIDADGVLQDEKIGDASIGKLKKLVARASELQTTAKPAQ